MKNSRGSLKKQAFRNELLAILARIEEKLDTRALDLLQTERLIAAFEKMANAADLLNRREPVSKHRLAGERK